MRIHALAVSPSLLLVAALAAGCPASGDGDMPGGQPSSADNGGSGGSGSGGPDDSATSAGDDADDDVADDGDGSSGSDTGGDDMTFILKPDGGTPGVFECDL